MKLKKLALGLVLFAFAVFGLAGCGESAEQLAAKSGLIERAHAAEVKAAELKGEATVKDKLIAKTEESADKTKELAKKATQDAANETKWARHVAGKAKKEKKAALVLAAKKDREAKLAKAQLKKQKPRA